MRILLLHGYAQNASTFQCKLRRLTQCIKAHYPEASFFWLDGPIQLTTGSTFDETNPSSHSCPEMLDLRGWFDLRDIRLPPNGLLDSLAMVAGVLARDGPFDGIISFSQGTTIAAVVASILESDMRHRTYKKAFLGTTSILDYPPEFITLKHPPLKFSIMYAARLGQGDFYHWLYHDPAILTPSCNFVGQWDSMVDYHQRDAARRVFSVSKQSRFITHGGGHFVPTDSANNKRVLDFLAGLLKDDQCGQIRVKWS